MSAHARKLGSGGIERLYSQFHTPEDITREFGDAVLKVLTKKWDELEVRRLEVKLVKAENLPAMDKSILGKENSADPYVVSAYIHTYVHVCVCVRLGMYVCIYVCMHIHSYISHLPPHTRTHINIYVCMHVCVCVCVCVCVDGWV